MPGSHFTARYRAVRLSSPTRETLPGKMIFRPVEDGIGVKFTVHRNWNATQQVVYWEGTGLVAYSWYVQRIVGSEGSTHVVL